MPIEKPYTAYLNWDFILDKIKEEECLLVLGPEAFTASDGISYTDKLIAHLDPAHNKNVQRYYEGDGFFLFDDLSKQTLICHDIKTFYNQALPGETLKLIAEIPFNVIFTVTPDKLLNRAFDEKDFAYQFGHYKKHKEPQAIKSPTRQHPLIYNLFGCLDSEESLILTHNDLYDYFKSIFARKSMPQLLKDQLRNIKNVLFLGVPFDKWYMQLLLRELEIHNAGYAFLRFAANQSLPGQIETFCTEQFKINFIFDQKEESKDVDAEVGQRTVARFVKDLHERCMQRGLIREKSGTELSVTDKIRACVANAEIEEAIDILNDSAYDTQLQDDVALLSGNFRSFKRRALNNLLSDNEREVQENKIAHTILSLAEQLDQVAI